MSQKLGQLRGEQQGIPRMNCVVLSTVISCITFTFPVVTQDIKACTILSSQTGSPQKSEMLLLKFTKL
jgi:hypothetical protein